MKFSLKQLLVFVTCVCLLLVTFVCMQRHRTATAAKHWILKQDGAYCLTYSVPGAPRTDSTFGPAYHDSLYGIHGDEFSNPVKEVAFEFSTLFSFKPLTSFQKLERIAVETVMVADIDLTPLARLPNLLEISFCEESRDTPEFDSKVSQLKKMIPNLRIEFDTDYRYRRSQTKTAPWVVNAGQNYGG